MRVLMIDSIANTGALISNELNKRGIPTVFVGKGTTFDDYVPDDIMKWRLPKKRYGKYFDIVHIHSPNLKKWLIAYPYLRSGSKLVCHWHGSDLRMWKKSFPIRRLAMKKADINYYSTLDLKWWLRDVKSELINCPIDTDRFVPSEKEPENSYVSFDSGGQSYKRHNVKHIDMPKYLQLFTNAEIRNRWVDDGLYSVLAFECASCGLKIDEFPWMDRKWVLNNAGKDVIMDKIIGKYNEILNPA